LIKGVVKHTQINAAPCGRAPRGREHNTMGQMHTVGKTATSISTTDGQTAVRYHATDVVKFTAETITLDSGGWRTVTTKARMNQAATQFGLGYQVYQLKGVWYVDTLDSTPGRLEFTDGMIINR